MNRVPNHRAARHKRATILLLVVSLLALLFVIITGFLALSRTERVTAEQFRKGDLINALIDDAQGRVKSLAMADISDSQGRTLAGPGAVWAQINGRGETGYLAPLDPVYVDLPINAASTLNTNLNVGGSWDTLRKQVWPSVSTLEPSPTLTPTPIPLSELMIENSLDNDLVLEVDDVEQTVRLAFMDADGDGIMDSVLVRETIGSDGKPVVIGAPGLNEQANALANSPVRIASKVLNPTLPSGTRINPAHIPNPGQSAAGDGFRAAWDRYVQSRKFEIGGRVVGHGGMVSLSAPTIATANGPVAPFNRGFSVAMFDAFSHPRDTGASQPWVLRSLPLAGVTGQNWFFDQFDSYSSAIEPLLRRRNGLPTARWAEGTGAAMNRRRVPLVMAWLQGELGGNTFPASGLPNTFMPKFRVGLGTASTRGDGSQRFNLADAANDGTDIHRPPGTGSINDRAIAMRNASLFADQYNRQDSNALLSYAYERRGRITSVSNSDDTMLKQIAGEPAPPLAGGSSLVLTTNQPSTYANEEKIFVGEAAKAFLEVDRPLGQNLQPGSGNIVYRPDTGRTIIERLARAYFDMISSHSRWSGETNATEAVTRRQQALMLAVNHVAFVAPRSTFVDAVNDPGGVVDVVSYNDSLNNTVYIGHGPQPFLTEVIGFSEDEDGDGDREISIAVEIFNPNDPYYVNGAGPDVFALRRDYFAVSVEGAADVDINRDDPTGQAVSGNGWARLDLGGSYVDPSGSTKLLRGRTFGTIVFEYNDNTHLDGAQNTLAPTQPISTIDLDGDMVVKLWRRRAPSRFTTDPSYGLANWYVVDTIQVRSANLDGGTGSSRRWVSVARDTTPTRTFGGDFNNDGTIDAYARWNVVTGTVVGAANSLVRTVRFPNGGFGAGTPPSQPGTASLGNQRYLMPMSTGGSQLVDPDVAGTPATQFGPTVPLVLMNAGPYNDPATPPTTENFHRRMNNLPLWGYTANGAQNDLRPRSFPTLGFMMFIPRFSHMRLPTQQYRPMSSTLDNQWKSSYGFQAAPTPDNYPADFGHMPIFDNTQDVRDTSYLDLNPQPGATAALPWGALVFDYFTTLDPTREGVDLMQVPGKININQAPWFTLSRLPVLGPFDSQTGQAPSLASLSNFATANRLQLPIRARGATLFPPVTASDPSPAFWDARVGVLTGMGEGGFPFASRMIHFEGTSDPLKSFETPHFDTRSNGYILGPWLAQTAASYRDGLPYLRETGAASTFQKFADAYLRNSTIPNTNARYRRSLYGNIRGQRTQLPPPGQEARPTESGFLSVGELLNVKGWDSSHPSRHAPNATQATVLDTGDFVKSVSLLALVDAQYLTTRSNTFTSYIAVMDRENPENSIRSQVTFDRSNLLPRVQYAPFVANLTGGGSYVPARPDLPRAVVLRDTDNNNILDTAVRFMPVDREPRIIAERRVSYFNTRFDE